MKAAVWAAVNAAVIRVPGAGLGRMCCVFGVCMEECERSDWACMRVNGANGSSCERGRARCSHVVLSTSVARRGCYGVMRDPWCYAQSGEVPEWRCERRDLLCVLYGRAWCEREDFED